MRHRAREDFGVVNARLGSMISRESGEAELECESTVFRVDAAGTHDPGGGAIRDVARILREHLLSAENKFDLLSRQKGKVMVLGLGVPGALEEDRAGLQGQVAETEHPDAAHEVVHGEDGRGPRVDAFVLMRAACRPLALLSLFVREEDVPGNVSGFLEKFCFAEGGVGVVTGCGLRDADGGQATEQRLGDLLRELHPQGATSEGTSELDADSSELLGYEVGISDGQGAFDQEPHKRRCEWSLPTEQATHRSKEDLPWPGPRQSTETGQTWTGWTRGTQVRQVHRSLEREAGARDQ